MAAIEVDVSGIEELQLKLDRVSTRLQQEVHTELRAEANLIKAEAQMNSPVRTGFLRSTIYAVETGDLQFKVGAWAWYAPYQEYGTRFMQGRHFLSNAIRTRWPIIKARIDWLVDKILNEEAR